MAEIQGVKCRLLGAAEEVGGYTLAMLCPSMGATTLYVPARSVLEAVQKGHEHLVVNRYGVHPVLDETGIWFGADAPEGRRAVEFDFYALGTRPRLRVEDPGDEGDWTIDLLPPVDPVECSDADLYWGGAKRKKATTGAIVRDKVTGRYGALVGWPDGSGSWMILFEPTPAWPDGHPGDLVDRRRDQFCLVSDLEAKHFEVRLSQQAMLNMNRMLRPGTVSPWGRNS